LAQGLGIRIAVLGVELGSFYEVEVEGEVKRVRGGGGFAGAIEVDRPNRSTTRCVDS